MRSAPGREPSLLPTVTGVMVAMVVGVIVTTTMSDITTEMAETSEFSEASREMVYTMNTVMDLMPVMILIVFLMPFVMALSRGASMPQIQLRKYPTTTFGTAFRVDVEDVTLHDENCVICDRTLRDGEKRVYASEFVVGGVPLRRYGGGTHHYCETCADPWTVRPIEIEAAPEAETATDQAAA